MKKEWCTCGLWPSSPDHVAKIIDETETRVIVILNDDDPIESVYKTKNVKRFETLEEAIESMNKHRLKGGDQWGGGISDNTVSRHISHCFKSYYKDKE